MQKFCNKCKKLKLFSDFHRDRSKEDGYRTTCKECKSLSDKNYKLNNRESIKQKDAAYYLANKEKCNSNSKRYYEENKQRLIAFQRQYNLERRDKVLNYLRDYYKERKLSGEYFTKYREYYLENKEYFLERAARRRASKLNATPPWLTKQDFEQIKELYEITKAFKLYTGEEYHVDHIIPLQGENVCGLHVPWNLQVISAKENLSKHNKLIQE